jgi:Domain of unknown function (DU1801)
LAEPKTKPTRVSLTAFLTTLRDPQRQRDARSLAALMRAATGARALMWGPSIVGFGRRAYTGSTGRITDWPLIAFAPRSTGLVLYLPGGYRPHQPLLRQLGKHRVGKGCLYIRRLADVDLSTLRRLITASVLAAAKQAR